jgi:hypothetical protein
MSVSHAFVASSSAPTDGHSSSREATRHRTRPPSSPLRMFASIAINVVVPAASSRASARGATRARPVAPLASSLASKNPLSERTGASLGDRRAFAGDDREGSVGGGTGDNGRMHVPTDAFGGMSPEYKAASALKSLFTMVAVRIVMAQEGAFYLTLIPIRARRRGERRSLRTLPGDSLLPPLAFDHRPRRLSTPSDAHELHPDVRSYGTTLSGVRQRRRRDDADV